MNPTVNSRSVPGSGTVGAAPAGATAEKSPIATGKSTNAPSAAIPTPTLLIIPSSGLGFAQHEFSGT